MTQAAAYNRSDDTGTMPDRIRRLRISPTGFPVPFFVTWFKDGKPCADGDGEPDFRVIDPRKMKRCIDHHGICAGHAVPRWVCINPSF